MSIFSSYHPNWHQGFLLFRNPLVMVSFWVDIAHNHAAYAASLPADRPLHVLVTLGYHYETPERMAEFDAEYRLVKKSLPNLELTVMCNSPKELDNFSARKYRARLIQQNIFLDERRYRICQKQKKEFDSIYVARTTPCKRHELAAEIPSLLIIGTYFQEERAYYEAVRAALPRAEWIPKVRGIFMYRQMNRARTALCLSEIEGAMYVSAEYLLCGLPIVNTPNIGGRDVLFPDEFTYRAEPTTASVAQGVASLIDRKINPYDVRAAVLEKMRPMRQAYIDLLHEILASENADRTLHFKMGNSYCCHKLGLRCPLLPWSRWTHGIKKQ